jgi:dihydropyrimidinase
MEFMSTVAVDDFFSGQAAALAGGTTMHIDFVIPTNGSLTAGFEAYEKKAKKSCMDYGFHMAITKWDETVSREMELMVKEKGYNLCSFLHFYIFVYYEVITLWKGSKEFTSGTISSFSNCRYQFF